MDGSAQRLDMLESIHNVGATKRNGNMKNGQRILKNGKIQHTSK